LIDLLELEYDDDMFGVVDRPGDSITVHTHFLPIDGILVKESFPTQRLYAGFGAVSVVEICRIVKVGKLGHRICVAVVLNKPPASCGKPLCRSNQ
jgi:hypothetical protein